MSKKKMKRCPNCNNPMNSEDSFCPVCGAAVQGEDYIPPSAENSGNKTVTIILYIVIALLIAGIIWQLAELIPILLNHSSYTL